MIDEYNDLDAVKKLVEALSDFEPTEQERIIRWARERLGLDIQSESQPISTPKKTIDGVPVSISTDIKSFMGTKNPKAATHFATTVAFYYKFVAPENQRKEVINGADLQDACRQVGRERLKDPAKTLSNAQISGLLDKGPDRGTYVLNTVGENLVAMTLPSTK